MTESEAPSAEPAEVTMLAALFSSAIVPSPPLRDVSRGIELEMRRIRGRGRRSAMNWRMQGEPRLLMTKPAS